jgi:lantibiotic leader peptide-processing serine protease
MHSLIAGLSLWVVLYQQPAIPAGAEKSLAGAGGSIVVRMPEIGALVVAGNLAVAAKAASDPNVAYVAEHREFQLIPDRVAEAPEIPPKRDPTLARPTRRTDEPMYGLQWDKHRIAGAPWDDGSYNVPQGRPEVVVAVLDTGAEAGHADIAPNLDAARSRAFYPVQKDPNGIADPASWDDRNGHGTWCLSAVAAPINGEGISGVAPRVRIAALKVLGDHGTGSFVSLAQALIYSGSRFDVASMSLIGYLRRDNPDHKALREMVQRAVAYARERGVTPIAALGNASLDIADPVFLQTYMPIPAELDGVIGVSATGWSDLKSSYSNFGPVITDVTAPGGDYGVQAPDPNFPGRGGVLGAWAPDSTSMPGASYAWANGTSMACPNAAGVAALIISTHGDFGPFMAKGFHLDPDTVESILKKTTRPLPCPEPPDVTYIGLSPPYPPNTQIGPVQRCEEKTANFYGAGMTDARTIVTP